MWEEETLHEAAQTSACWECLSGWAKWGESDPWPIRGSWAVPFAALLPGNNISLEGKQNGGHRADRSCGRGQNCCCLLSTKHVVAVVVLRRNRGTCELFLALEDELTWWESEHLFDLLHLKRPAQLQQRISNSKLGSFRGGCSQSARGQRHRAGRGIIFCPAFAKNKHTHVTTDCSSLRVGPPLCETSKHGLLIMGAAIPASTLAP